MTKTTRRFDSNCECDCGKKFHEGDVIPTSCPDCGQENESTPARRLTRTERLQMMADSGCDTWEEARCER